MDRLIEFLQRVTCRWQGHRWGYLSTLGQNAQGYVWTEWECRRCREREQRKT